MSVKSEIKDLNLFLDSKNIVYVGTWCMQSENYYNLLGNKSHRLLHMYIFSIY